MTIGDDMTNVSIFKLLLCSFFLLCCLGSLQAKPNSIRVVSEEWQEHTNKDGSGLYWDIIRAVYEGKQINVDLATYPYKRTVHSVKTNSADAWVGSYRDEEAFAIYPKWHFDADVVVAIYKKEHFSQWNGEATIDGKKVGWIRGYDYDQYLTISLEKTEISTRKSGLGMLKKDRIDVFIDAKSLLEEEIQKPYIQNGFINLPEYEVKRVLQLNLFLGFANTNKGKELAKIWDQRFEAMLDSGEIRKLYAKWNKDTWVFQE